MQTARIRTHSAAKATSIGLLLGFLLILGGCATPTGVGWNPLPFEDQEYAPYRLAGTGSIRGQVFAKTRGGDVKKGAGSTVFLMPLTSFGNQRLQSEFIKGERAAKDPDPRHSQAVIKKTADGEGRFEFKNVAAGRYVVFSNVTWEVPSTGYFTAGMLVTQGGLVFREVEVANGVESEAMLSR